MPGGSRGRVLRILLGIDVGTTGAKAAAFDAEGRLLAAGGGEYPARYPRPGWAEQDPEDWWKGVRTALNALFAQIPGGALRVCALAVSSQAPTMLPLDEAGRPLRPALIWMDRRSDAEASLLAERFGPDLFVRKTGNRPDPFYVAPKILWLKKNEPELFRKTRLFSQANGYINFRLTDAHSMDNVHAALLELRDWSTGEWDEEICSMCGVEPGQFPPVYPGHAVIGTVTGEASDATGLARGTPVMAGTVDGAAAAVEAGAYNEGTAAEMTGTSTVLLMPNLKGITEPAFIAMPHAIPGLFLLLGAMATSGASLRWFRDTLGNAAVEAVDPFDMLTREAEQSPPGSSGVVFLPYMMGERSPIWHTNARGVFFGLSLATPKSALIRAILEGTAFALRHNLEHARAAGVSIDEIRSVGGGTKSALWNQIKADVLGLPILLPEAGVGAPFGCALLAGMGSGVLSGNPEELGRMVRIKARYEPNPHNREIYEKQYRLYRRVYEHLREDFDLAAH